MSRQLISRSPDLRRLRDEGYDVEVRSNNLVVHGVPYVTADQTVAYGALVSELSTSGDTTTMPGTHEIFFVGSIPCDHNGNELTKLLNQRGQFPMAGDLLATCSFSHKPRGSTGYPDYYEKVTSYAAILEGYAQVIDATVTARTCPPIAAEEDESVFRYLDSATSRARIGAVTEKLELTKVVIIGPWRHRVIHPGFGR